VTQPPEWTETGAFAVAEGIYRIPLPLPMDGLRAVNVYAIETDAGLVMVDGGWAIEESRQLLESSLAAIDYKVSDITRFLVTHVHRDHYTQAVAVRREFGAQVVLGIGDKPTLDFMQDTTIEVDPNVVQLQRAGAFRLADGWTRTMGSDRPAFDNFDMPDEWLSHDLSFAVGAREIHAVSTPGHTQGHYVYVDQAAGLLFAGDHVLPTITPSIGFEPVFADQPLQDFLRSLAKVRAMPDMMLLPAHGPVTGSSHARIDELIAHHDARLELCRQAVESGIDTAYGVATELPWTRRGRSLEELDVFNAVLATMETLTHLELLTAQERVRREEVDGVVRFRPTRLDSP
jgi:glyoxylase-like metal-dependent hydrolase (beta-lactamase superfamily II)